ncbi:unnamed protein product [Macrosiphum euphorbiae]|uniref:Endonuclease/exonuclease/phosphatase domain-containing protein n=1 Tax=Macrosiphum euphorbiae TaxID=13131 RepID=A0AAV0XR93_9HEMI|nr:unnamed protein product [Macrosiphum euphorbiae]
MINTNSKSTTKRPLSGPALMITSINIEGLTSDKEILLENICKETLCDIICIQETHRGKDRNKPKIRGMKLVAEIPHDKHGSAIFTKPMLEIKSSDVINVEGIEILTIELTNCTVTSVYKPPNIPFTFHKPDNFNNSRTKIIIGDFNSHHTEWGYENTNDDGERVEQWADGNQLSFIHDSKLPPSFNSARWKRGYNPDLIMVSENIRQKCVKIVAKPIPRSQHRSIVCSINVTIKPTIMPMKRRFNFRKANWNDFSTDLDSKITNLAPLTENDEAFVNIVKRVSRKHIPRGCRTEYITGLSSELTEHMRAYTEMYEKDPFGYETINKGEFLLEAIGTERRANWINLVESIDMKHSSQKAWGLMKKLNNDPKQRNSQNLTTPDQIAHQLLLNGKGQRETNQKRTQKKHTTENEECGHFKEQFNIEELNEAIKMLKNRKAAGLDDICVEQIKEFGPKTKQWILELFNEIRSTYKLPKIWRKAHIIALLKPGKEPTSPKNFRPVSLLCHLYKAFERMVHNHIVRQLTKN